MSLPVPDQDAALAFYRDVLGCELVVDAEIWPGARLVQVQPPGSDVAIVLLPPDSEIPVALRLATPSAQDAHDRLRATGATLHNDQVLHLEGAPPMFAFADPWGNQLVFMEE
ncbi:VOC family protein [Phycicoccus avicenniae]|uniref:VOC family protein n=1 Tax=Phycicoccus avicenniae TaxID=2828860 RepID=UPI003D2CB957